MVDVPNAMKRVVLLAVDLLYNSGLRRHDEFVAEVQENKIEQNEYDDQGGPR